MRNAALLMPVQRDVGRIEIKHNLPRRPLMRLQEYGNQQRTFSPLQSILE